MFNIQGDTKKTDTTFFGITFDVVNQFFKILTSDNINLCSTYSPSFISKMPWKTEEKAFIISTYFRLNSIRDTQLEFRKKFGTRDFPVCSLIYAWINKFKAHGTVKNINGKDRLRQTHSGRPKSSRSPPNIAAVQDSVIRSPCKSVRRRSQELGINREAVRRILTTDLQLYPYRIQIKQQLSVEDTRKRMVMCQWFCDRIENEPDFLNNVWFSDEAHFLLSGHVNSKNNVYWGKQAPEYCLERPLHSAKCTAWIAISTHGIIGPFWFEDVNGQALTINTLRYIQVLDRFWTELGRRRGITRATQWFQQDGATPHTSNESLAWLQQHFPGKVISRRCDPEWAPHSPDLNPPDFYLWGFLKDRVFANNPQTIADLKTAISATVQAIPREECGRVIANFARRARVCLQRRGGHLEHILKRQ